VVELYAAIAALGSPAEFQAYFLPLSLLPSLLFTPPFEAKSIKQKRSTWRKEGEEGRRGRKKGWREKEGRRE
jgi:hypothetical protein